MRRRRYIPVAAKCEALKVYRMRRSGDSILGDPPLSPVDAIRSTEEFFSGHYTARMARGDVEDAARFLDGYRAAAYYVNRVHGARWSW